MQLTKGTRLGPYEIVAPLGAGGMGEVYRARDTRLNRIVAIKILPSEFASDTQLRLRFEREAKTISTLSHPHICALHDVGREDGVEYLVMEHCEGKTLARRIAEGALPIEQALQCGIEIADALDKAHQQGIIHRDLKPSNIMLTKSGVKLLDFGLAKQNLDSSLTQSTVQPVTEEGKILGTIQYMAPELFVGKEADTRSDIFSLGLVLYEMVAGKPAFSGTSKASLIAAILEHEPRPLSDLKPKSPSLLDRLIRSCLAKDPVERVQTAHDVVLQLRWIAEGVSLPPRPAARRNIIAWSVAIVAPIIVLTSLALWKSRAVERPAPSVRRLAISVPSSTPLWASANGAIAVSPDGRRLVYSSRNEGVIRLFLYSLDTSASRVIPGTEGGFSPFFSPDGEWLGFCTNDGELKKVLVSGGTPFTISTGRTLRGATWGPDDTIVFAERRMPLQRLSAAGGAPQALTPPDPRIEARWPFFFPDGKHVLFTVGDHSGDFEKAKLAVLDLKTARSKVVVEGATGGQFVGGRLLYAHSRTLFAVPFDLGRMKVTGSPRPVVDDLEGPFGSGVAHFAVSTDGSLFYITHYENAGAPLELAWADRRGRISPLSLRRQVYEELPELSPDGKQLIIPVGSFPRYDLWRYEIDRDSWTRMTSEATNIGAVWSPDGKQIVFTSNRDGVPGLYLMPSDGSAAPKRIAPSTNARVAFSWSPDGQTIAFGEENKTTRIDVMLLSLKTMMVKPFLSSPFNEQGAVFSPDGRWVAFESNETGRNEIYVQGYPEGGRKWRVSSDGGTAPRWRGDGRELFYFKPQKVMAVDVRLGAQFTPGRPRLLFESGPDVVTARSVTKDGQRFIMFRGEKQSTPQTHIGVVLGLF